jgi:AAA ATPase domain
MFVGREVELGLLGELVRQVGEGTGGAVWVGGHPGIGKSALIAAGLAGARARGCRVCAATAHEQSPVFPLQVLLEAVGAGAGVLAGGVGRIPVRSGLTGRRSLGCCMAGMLSWLRRVMRLVRWRSGWWGWCIGCVRLRRLCW